MNDIFGRKPRGAMPTLESSDAAERRAGSTVHAVGGAARDRDHRNLPNNQVARQPLKQSPKRSCGKFRGASIVPSGEDAVKFDSQAARKQNQCSGCPGGARDLIVLPANASFQAHEICKAVGPTSLLGLS